MMFLFVKLYEDYKRTRALNPEHTVVLYATSVALMTFFSVFVILFEVLNKVFFDKHLGKIHPLFLLGIVIVVSIKLYKIIYKKFFRQNKMATLQEKYRQYSINRIALYLAVVILPILILLCGTTISVFLTGGKILGTKVNGLIG